MSSAAPVQPRQTHIEQIESGIVQLLKDAGLNAKWLIETFPDNPDQYDMANVKLAALVQYAGSKYLPEEGHGGAQPRLSTFAIHLYFRASTLGEDFRPLYLLDEVRYAVQGCTVAGVALTVTRDGLVDQTGALWRYVLELTGSLPAIPRAKPTPSTYVTDFSKEPT